MERSIGDYSKYAQFELSDEDATREVAARERTQEDRARKHRDLSRFRSAGPDQRSASRMRRKNTTKKTAPFWGCFILQKNSII